MNIERDGHTVATVRKALVSRSTTASRSTSSTAEGMEAKGNSSTTSTRSRRGGDKAAEVSEAWFRVRDTYGIEIVLDEDDALILQSRSASTR